MTAARQFVNEAGETIYAIMAEFDTTPGVYHAAEKVRDAGYTKWDVYSPFPIHGIEDAMGMPRTKLPLLVAMIGLTGAGLGFLMQWWMTAVNFPIVVQGKPYGAWEPFTPITFELGVLFSAFAALIGMLAMNALPRWHHPLFKKERFLSVSDDRFMVCIETADPRFDPESTRRLLESAGARHIELVEE